MHLKKQLAVCALTAIAGLGLCTQALADGHTAEYEKMLRAAEAAQKTAASAGGEWRDTGKILKAAKKAADAGDYAKATGLANQARQQGELGYKQALAEKNVGTPTYLK